MWQPLVPLHAFVAAMVVACFCSSPVWAEQDAPTAAPVAEQPAAPPQIKLLSPPPSAEQVQRWIEQLDSDEFLTRETATHNLIASGDLVFAPLRKALASSSLEATTRGLHVLQQLALYGEPETKEAARTVLEDFANQASTSLGRRAATAIVALNAQRSESTLAELQALGANVTRRQDIDTNGAIVESVDAVEIGSDWKGTNYDLRRLKWLGPINRLVLFGDSIDDEGLRYAAKMQSLKSLHVYRAKVTDQGIAALADAEKLQEIGLYYMPISDVGIAALSGNKSLTALHFYGTNATAEAVGKLKADLGLANIDYRAGAFLGVGCDTVNQQCVISNVHPGSPAAKGGLETDDVLLSFDGKKVADFTALTALISHYKAGSTVDVEVERVDLEDGNPDPAPMPKKLRVTLGEWDVGIFVRNRLSP